VNNNPFEYWIVNSDPGYDNLMLDIQLLLEHCDVDVEINNIFSDMMFAELLNELEQNDIVGLVQLKKFWVDDYRARLAIGGFLKDKSLGTKRLASMPDRITNTINLQHGGVCLRPSALNAYDGGSLASLSSWWHYWKQFMFHQQVQVFTGLAGSHPIAPPAVVCSLITPMLR
jgi:hypothetical protein